MRRNSPQNPLISPAFRKWFGKSMVVDQAGTPLVVYHGTKAGDIECFYPGERRTISFSANPAIASRYAEDRLPDFDWDDDSAWDDESGLDPAPTVIPVYLRAENLFDPENPCHRDIFRIVNLRGQWEILEKYVDRFIAAGFDGILVDGYNDIAVFRPEQIKSAIGNSGRFNANSPDITDGAGSWVLALDGNGSDYQDTAARGPKVRI